ncbi:MAG: hypothetical protein HBSAPP02_29210 [Phycisphaerae bacterium]|nr:MAG: hypothetical protein HRU71_01985 [Planctomycetia bacterium]GJQ27889.1 MAG: hypothetical protein HBSAPP02_29210 [Phycisphaerae bacterium]
MDRGVRHPGLWIIGGAAALLIAGGMIGCRQDAPSPIATSVGTNLLMGDPWEDSVAGQIGRTDWPLTWNGYHSPQETVYIEYYRDFFGNEFSERQTPQRNFRSYSVGAAQRPGRP